jgi:hypothetical protein
VPAATAPGPTPAPSTSAVPVATTPAAPAVLDAPAFLAYLNQVRSDIGDSPFTRNSCLDAQAATLARFMAATGGGNSISVSQPRALCGLTTVFTGWDTSADPTGQGQAAAALTRGPAGQTSPVANAALHQIGFAMVQLQVNGPSTAYLVVWLLGG